MADKQVTVAVPEDRVPEFYAWFAAFLAADRAKGAPGGPGFGPRGPGLGGGRGGPFGHRHGEAQPWTAADAEQA
ncbi:MAG: hypothetical protein JWM31_3489, partial [Solirubrobacterales bacterium]|nr:hypothetical protein [Solirubrobacterales bacterium]